MQIPSSVVIYIKKLIKETVSRNKTLRVDGFLTNDELPTVEAPEDKAVWKAEFDKMDDICKTLDSVVSPVGQVSLRTLYYRRYLILEYTLSDHKKGKTMLNDWESALTDNTSK